MAHGGKHVLRLLLRRAWMFLFVAMALANLLRWAALRLALEVLRLPAALLLVAATHFSGLLSRVSECSALTIPAGAFRAAVRRGWAGGKQVVDLSAPPGEGLLVQAIVDVVAAFFVDYQTRVPHDPQMLRHGPLRYVEL